MSPSVRLDAARHLNKFDLVFLTFLTVLSGKSYDSPFTKGKPRLKEVGKALAHGQSSHVLLEGANLKLVSSQSSWAGRGAVSERVSGKGRAAGSPQMPMGKSSLDCLLS